MSSENIVILNSGESVEDIVVKVLKLSDDDFFEFAKQEPKPVRKAALYFFKSQVMRAQNGSKDVIRKLKDTTDHYLNKAYNARVQSTEDEEKYVHPDMSWDEFKERFWKDYRNTFAAYLSAFAP